MIGMTREDLPVTNEERQRAMDFIVAQQAKNSVDIEKLNETHDKAEHRLDREERILKLIVRAGMRSRKQIREHDERLREHDKRFAEMREFQAHSDRRLDALIDIVRADRNGRSS
jgi:hypothetical protein